MSEAQQPINARITLEQLLTICSSGDRLDWTRYPVAVDGLVVATEGRILLAVEGLHLPAPPAEVQPPSSDSVAIIRHHLKPLETASATIAALGDLQRWAGAIPSPELESCGMCCGTGQCTCPDCDHEHPCGVCDATGKVAEAPKSRPGRIGGVGVNRNLLARLLSAVQGAGADCPVLFAKAPSSDGTTSCLRLEGPGWRAALMPFHGYQEAPDVEVYVPGAAQAAEVR